MALCFLLIASQALQLATGFVTFPVESPAGFNVSAALESHGVYVDDIPYLSDTETRLAPSPCSVACSTLQLLFGSEALDRRGEDSYDGFLEDFWSQIQADISPACIFMPDKATDLSVVVLLSRFTQCPFAVRSGGHAAFAGASNIKDGITVSLEKFQRVSLSKDMEVASVGAGNVWGSVYEYLEPYGLTVIGGRLYNIGVGGLTLGGGVSYFSNSHGWACDNVESYDVVLANGAIVRATPSQFSDLYWALRGGGNNFGIVYNFNLRTTSFGGEMWAGSRTYTEDQFPAVFEAYSNMVDNASEDPKANFYLVWVIVDGVKLAVPAMWYEDPEVGGNATAYSEWNAIPAMDDTTKVRNVVEWGRETLEDSPYGLREVFYMMTIKADSEVHAFAVDQYFEKSLAVTEIDGFFSNIVTQGISVPQMEQMQKNGGNALGLDPACGPVYILQVCVRWNKVEDDNAVYKLASDILEATKAEAVKKGVDNDYIYMNYASTFQDVIGSYGGENKAKLKQIAHKYDPQQVFQKLQPGYFKLDRAPTPDPDFFSS